MTKEPLIKAPQEALELNTKQNIILDSAEEHLVQVDSEEVELVPTNRDSHIGKEEEVSDGSKYTPPSSKKQSSKRKFSQSEGAMAGSESDEGSVRTSSSQRSHEIKVSSSEKERDSRRSAASLKTEEQVKSSSRSRSDRDEKYSSYSRSERDTRYSSSRSRSDRERRRSRSHSRSRSERGSRTSSSYSRSERSHYYDSDRRYRRSSPYREKTRYSRSYVDSRTRESSDSEEEYRRSYFRSSDSRRTSSHSSSSYRESRTSSYSRSERDSKIESSHTDSERKGKSAKSDREFKRTSDSDVSKRFSPVSEARHRRGASHSKADGSASSSRHKSSSSKASAPKSEKFKSSFCCTEPAEIREQSNCIDLEAPCVQSCETKTAVTQKPETERTVSLLSPLSDSPAFKKLVESKEASPPSKAIERAGIESHDSIKEGEFLVKVTQDNLRTFSPTEPDLNGSPECRAGDTALFCTSKTEEVAVSSDDSLDRTEAPFQSQSSDLNELSSNGFQDVYLSKEDDLDDTPVPLAESSHLLKEKADASIPSEYEFAPSCIVNVNHSKITKKVDDLTDPCNKTKDPDSSLLSDDATLYYSEVEIEAESLDTKAAPDFFLIDAHVNAQNETCQYVAPEDENASTSVCENASLEKCDDRSFSLLENNAVRDSSAEECSVDNKSDNQYIAQQPQTSENDVLPPTETALQEKSEELSECPEVAVELNVPLVDSVLEKPDSPFKNEHSYYLEMPAEVPEKEGPDEEEGTVALDEEALYESRPPSPEVSEMKEKGEDSLMGSVFSDALSPTCDIVVTIEETETVAEATGCDSSGGTPDHISLRNEGYSDSAESASEPGSDASDSEESDSDSDDSSVPRNRLQSVVVVPKNSTIAMEESSFCPSRNSQSSQRYLEHWEDGRPESSKPFYEEMPDDLDSSSRLQNEIKCVPPREVLGGLATSTELSTTEAEGFQLGASQPQSDGVDSTSQSEFASDSGGKSNPEERTILSEPIPVVRTFNRPQEMEMHYQNFDMNESVSRLQGGVSKPDSRQGKPGFGDLTDTGEFPREDGFHATEDLSSMGWDFSQPEKPSSTYQQPDSSYGLFSGYVYPPGSGPYVRTHNYWPDSGYWDPRLSNRPPEISYERIQGQVPDSLTEDHEEYEEVDRWVDESHPYYPNQFSKFHLRDPREKGSVQAHEISSNSAKDPAVPSERKEQVNKVLDKNDMKERGPLKKRRQDFESDSESDGDSQERKKVKMEGELMSGVPQDSSAVRPLCHMEDFRDPQRWKEFSKQGKMPCYFDLIEENVYLTER